MRARLWLVAVLLAPFQGAWAAPSGKIAWQAQSQVESTPGCFNSDAFWNYETWSGTNQASWDALSPSQQKAKLASFCKNFQVYQDADDKLKSAKFFATYEGPDQRVQTLRTAEAEARAPMSTVKSYFGANSPYAAALDSRLKELSDQEAVWKASANQKKLAANGGAIQNENSGLARAAADQNAAGLANAYDGANREPASLPSGAQGAPAHVSGKGVEAAGVLAGGGTSERADGGPEPDAFNDDGTQRYVDNENKRWFGYKARLDCTLDMCPEQRGASMRILDNQCDEDPAWCDSAKKACANGSADRRSDECLTFGWMRDRDALARPQAP